MQLTEAECHSPSTVLGEIVAKDYTTGLSGICREKAINRQILPKYYNYCKDFSKLSVPLVVLSTNIKITNGINKLLHSF